MTKIIPAIIPEDLDDLKNSVARVKDFVDVVQVDMVDRIFAPTATLLDFPEELPFWKDIQYEMDLMVENPEDYLDDLIYSGVSAVIIHEGSTRRYEEIRKKCRKLNVDLGYAIRPSSDTREFDSDFIQVMGNDKIGFHGVELDEKVYGIIKEIREKTDKDIAVDIGVNFDTAPLLVKAGATKLISGSAIFEGNIKENIKYFQSL